MGMSSPPPEALSPRLSALKADLVAVVPTRSAAASADLASRTLGDVLIKDLSRRARLIRPRPRDVVVWPEVHASSHHAAFAGEIADVEARFAPART